MNGIYDYCVKHGDNNIRFIKSLRSKRNKRATLVRVLDPSNEEYSILFTCGNRKNSDIEEIDAIPSFEESELVIAFENGIYD